MTDDELKGKLIDIVGRIKVAEVVGHSIREERFAAEIIALFRKAGWVEKEEDQSLPEIPDYLTEDEKQVRLATMHIMQYQGWRKVKAEK